MNEAEGYRYASSTNLKGCERYGYGSSIGVKGLKRYGYMLSTRETVPLSPHFCEQRHRHKTVSENGA